MIATALTTLLSATAVLADTTSSKTVEAPKMAQTQQCETNGSFKSHLDSLVASGTLDQDKEDAIQSAGQKDDSNKGNHYGEFNRGHQKGQIKTILDGLVKSGTITQAQEDSIQSAITTAQLKHDANKDQPKNHQNGQVNDGTRNHVQEDAIQD